METASPQGVQSAVGLRKSNRVQKKSVTFGGDFVLLPEDPAAGPQQPPPAGLPDLVGDGEDNDAMEEDNPDEDDDDGDEDFDASTATNGGPTLRPIVLRPTQQVFLPPVDHVFNLKLTQTPLNYKECGLQARGTRPEYYFFSTFCDP